MYTAYYVKQEDRNITLAGWTSKKLKPHLKKVKEFSEFDDINPREIKEFVEFLERGYDAEIEIIFIDGCQFSRTGIFEIAISI